MAMDPDSLDPGRIAGGILAAFLAAGAVDSAPDFKLTRLSKAIAAAVVKEITENAEVAVDLGPPAKGTIT